MRNKPDIIYLSTIGMVFFSTFILVNHVNTVLSEVVVFAPLVISVSLFQSHEFLKEHKDIFTIAILASNLIFYSVLATPIWLWLRKRQPLLCGISLAVLPVIYFLFLFLFFPATDGP